MDPLGGKSFSFVEVREVCGPRVCVEGTPLERPGNVLGGLCDSKRQGSKEYEPPTGQALLLREERLGPNQSKPGDNPAHLQNSYEVQLHMYIYIHIYICVYIYVYIYMRVCMHE